MEDIIQQHVSDFDFVNRVYVCILDLQNILDFVNRVYVNIVRKCNFSALPTKRTYVPLSFLLLNFCDVNQRIKSFR